MARKGMALDPALSASLGSGAMDTTVPLGFLTSAVYRDDSGYRVPISGSAEAAARSSARAAQVLALVSDGDHRLLGQSMADCDAGEARRSQRRVALDRAKRADQIREAAANKRREVFLEVVPEAMRIHTDPAVKVKTQPFVAAPQSFKLSRQPLRAATAKMLQTASTTALLTTSELLPLGSPVRGAPRTAVARPDRRSFDGMMPTDDSSIAASLASSACDFGGGLRLAISRHDDSYRGSTTILGGSRSCVSPVDASRTSHRRASAVAHHNRILAATEKIEAYARREHISQSSARFAAEARARNFAGAARTAEKRLARHQSAAEFRSGGAAQARAQLLRVVSPPPSPLKLDMKSYDSALDHAFFQPVDAFDRVASPPTVLAPPPLDDEALEVSSRTPASWRGASFPLSGSAPRGLRPTPLYVLDAVEAPPLRVGMLVAPTPLRAFATPQPFATPGAKVISIPRSSFEGALSISSARPFSPWADFGDDASSVGTSVGPVMLTG
ncbi:hypothetical protein M885DRAFT_623998 [Pelagophyceae sp. CCMP2097]|nr:hypothetical protein M885DRAFT_623998 [Pelagophyceae sp. CCMP2097]